MIYFTGEHQGQDKVFAGFTVFLFSVIGMVSIYYAPEIDRLFWYILFHCIGIINV